MKIFLKKKDRRDERGMTLVELVMACSIMVLLMGIISVMIIRSFFVNKYTFEQGLNATALQSSLSNFSRYLREARQSDAGGYLIEYADDFELYFFADIDNDSVTERVHYFVENYQLKIGSSDPNGFPVSYPAEDEEIRIIGNGVVNNATQPVFYYYNQDYPSDVINNPLTAPVSPQEIGMIKIDLYVNIDTTHVPDSMRMGTFVRPRNIN
ncbi:MAG: type II secretion system protein [Patescibacteria group bacterium]|jgi:type II secretory pathway pseudopilin PulG|nr:type II secretion system protein [Patescibacteria group bacterium]